MLNSKGSELDSTIIVSGNIPNDGVERHSQFEMTIL